MNIQQAFDTMAKHLLTQNAKSAIVDEYEDVKCKYRGEGGLQCAVGCLIKDEFYDPTFEGQSASDDDVQFALISSGIPMDLDMERMLNGVQAIHDYTPVNEWREELNHYATMHNLSTQALST